MASFFCQELIKNTLTLCTSYINRLLSEKNSRAQEGPTIFRQRAPSANKETSPERLDLHSVISDPDFDGERLGTRSVENEPADPSNLVKRTSYYVEENEKLLNLLITNCEPILSEIVHLIDHFNSYNGMHKVIEKSQLFS